MRVLIGDTGTGWPEEPPLEGEIERYGLCEEIEELDKNGLAIVPPEKLGLPDGKIAQLIDAVLRLAEARTGGRFDVERGCLDTLTGGRVDRGFFYLSHLLLEGSPFAELYVNPVKRVFMRHMLGDEHILSTSNAWIKWASPDCYGPTLGMHADCGVVPPPWPVAAPHVANMNLLLTDYSRENGALAYVPGSHHLGKRPEFPEAAERAQAVEAPAGSLVVFHGAVWHGAFPRQTSGLRLSIHGLHARPYFIPQHDYRNKVPPYIMDRSPDPVYLSMLARGGDPLLFGPGEGPVPLPIRARREAVEGA